MGNLLENDIILKNYRIERTIGQGAFGEVFLATHTGLNGKRAVKVLLRDEAGIGSSDYEEYRNRFRQESQLMEWFSHPNVIRVYDFQEEDNTLFLIMEYAAGGSLKTRLEKKRISGEFFTVDETIKTGIEIAEGLSVLHKRDVIHRDLKPSNILFDETGCVKVADLGLAQIPGGQSMRSQLSVLKPHPGTPVYMSPEQEISGMYLRPASDVFTLGLILFEMLSGRNYKNIKPGTHLQDMVPQAPDWLDSLLVKMLSENPKDRPWDGAEAADALKSGGRETRITEQTPPERTAKPDIAQNAYQNKTPEKEIPLKEKIPNPIWKESIPENTKFHEKPDIYDYLKKSWIFLVALIIILGYSLIRTTGTSGTSAKPYATARTANTGLVSPTRTPVMEETAFYDITGKWVVTESVDDPNEQGPAWLEPQCTMEYNAGLMYMKCFGTGSGTNYRISGRYIFFEFNDGHVEPWEIIPLDSSNSIELKKSGSRASMKLFKQ
ncbi:serine/threonine protein kinase [Leptolinea tardivitalis]|uniref:non-specific serine/threonine protein kinase n=1 Tax=Leptolinea tardivitalis TaxID=229920 RepID=A0A0P6WMY9_9CHLR|nr:serine/threonine-protein kinase [Leptolinea tardivitalis]KPL70185.1 hypothetical protein ADM99_13395 [Leptolinea tardivitalis]GAP21715.1 serine/threonine protein kinase [Leptolinea tardivitalis]